jgi:hypothetical protein
VLQRTEWPLPWGESVCIELSIQGGRLEGCLELELIGLELSQPPYFTDEENEAQDLVQ